MSKSPIVARINALLSLKGISKKQFFKDCKISSSAFSQWNTGKIEVPRGKNIERIANYLEVSVEYLLYGDMQEVQAKKERPSPCRSPCRSRARCSPTHCAHLDLD